jgi:hypothetical protein
MENSRTSPVVITGKKKTHIPKFIENWPLHEKFEYTNCIICFYIVRPENGDLTRYYVNAEYFEEVTNENMENYHFGKYAPTGFYVLYAEKEAVEKIIEDIKNSKGFIE